MSLAPEELARTIDHTLLRVDATRAAIVTLCAEALEHGFHAVCVHGGYVATASSQVADKGVEVASVVGFPCGAGEPAARAFEARRAIEHGATELDVVARIGALVEGDEALFLDDLGGIRAAAGDAPVKVILETGLLTDDRKRRGAELVREAGCAFVKTSTGFGPSGATVEDVQLLRETVGDACGVKASGGIRDLQAAEAMLRAGATRLGTSSGVALIEAARRAAGRASGPYAG